MREIKFRVYEKHLKMYLNEGVEIGQLSLAERWDKYLILEQYTGRKDKNGKEIYEGDKTAPEDGVYAVCAFHKGSFGWWFYEEGDPEPIEFDVMTALLLERVEIVGNIREEREWTA